METNFTFNKKKKKKDWGDVYIPVLVSLSCEIGNDRNLGFYSTLVQYCHLMSQINTLLYSVMAK